MDYLPPNVKRTKPQTWQWAERPLGIAMGETRLYGLQTEWDKAGKLSLDV